MTPLVELRAVRKDFGDRTVLAGVDLTVSPGDTVAIMGPSGSGKSTLLNIVGALDRPTSGQALVGGADVARLSALEVAAYRANCVGFVFQEHHLLPQLTAIENVLLPALAAQVQPSEARALELLTRVGVAHRAGAFPWEMSGGERQRTAVARALMNRPHILLCDEPTGNLDRETGAGIIALLLEVVADAQSGEGGMAAIMVTHNPDHAARFGRRYVLDSGVLRDADA